MPQGFAGGQANDLDDRGTVLIDFWQAPSGYLSRAYLWTEASGLTALPLPDGYTFTEGVAMDRHGSVLLVAKRGRRPEDGERSFLWRDGTLRDLPGPRGALEVEYLGLSDHGWLIGSARPGEGSKGRRWFVAEPVR